MEQEEREDYEAPELVDYGDVTDLTAQGDQPNADVPAGNNNTAYSL